MSNLLGILFWVTMELYTPKMTNMPLLFLNFEMHNLITNGRVFIVQLFFYNLITERTPAALWWCMSSGLVRARLFSLGGVSVKRVVPLG